MSGSPVQRIEGSIEPDGVRLHYRAWIPPDPVAALLIVHGLSDHSGRYEAVGLGLAEKGIASWALDQRGHGLSGGRRGHAPRFARLLDDLDAFRREVVAAAGPGVPLFLFGQSMGGLVAIRYLEEFPDAFRGAIIVSPWLGTAVAVPRWKSVLAVWLARLVPALPFRANIPAEHLSHDPAVVKAYREDPLVHDIITPRLFMEVQSAMGVALERAGHVRTPALILIPGSDRIVDSARGLAFAHSVPAGGAEIRQVEGAYHEILNEPDGARHVADIAVWISERVPAAPD